MFLSKARNGYYYVYYQKPTGKTTRISTKCKMKRDAVKFLSEFEKHIKVRSLSDTIPITLEKFKWEYLKYSEANHTYKTTYSIKVIFKYFLKFCGNIELSNISERMAEDYVQLKAKKSNYNGQKHLAHLRKAFIYAITRKYVNDNPFKSIQNFKIPEKQPLFFSREAFQTLINTIDNEDIKDLTIFAVNTGLRQMELITLEWTQIDFKNMLLILDNRSDTTKSKKIRSIPLNITTLQILNDREMNKKGERVFTINDKPITQDQISKRFKKYVKKAKVNPKLNFHSLRHTFASWLVQKNISLYVIKELLGHASISTTEIYSHLRTDDLRSSVDLLDD